MVHFYHLPEFGSELRSPHMSKGMELQSAAGMDCP